MLTVKEEERKKWIVSDLQSATAISKNIIVKDGGDAKKFGGEISSSCISR